MEPETLRQIQGGVTLATDAVEAAVGAAAALQQTIVRQVYAPFALLGPLAAPALAVEQIQTAITAQVYRSILVANRLIAHSAGAVLEQQRRLP